MNIFVSGEHEPLKAGVHGALGLLAAVCAGYNLIAATHRRDRHLKINAVVYAFVTVYEVAKVVHHLPEK